ncbi:ABC transporter ATP-binding protein [Devosia sp. RR2S18]|uniref:ABC transporter ATP-binding protein n=1 Tax=Devosia rhizosphaerae TaxID=3049774 RepID=UPI00254190C5|nr:ABC transporter ATP-binding protein [Devosia sp. RR2S18]WIJ25906.1 ABC transporter ATP-binding protein [Devosia sp. RR2S18]
MLLKQKSTERTILSLKSVTKRFGDVHALREVDLDIAKRDIVCLVGQSGCGKSTLLRAIAGIEGIEAGTIALDGQVVSSADTFVEPEKRNVGFMFQDYALFPHLSARQNIAFGLKNLDRKAAAARVEDVIARLGIEALVDRYPHMLSGGEQQRVALARALAPQPHILLMDEPFSNLDRGLRDSVRQQTLSLLKALGTTTIIVTHDPEEALTLGDEIVLMHKGGVVETGSGDAIYSYPQTAYAAAFFSQVNWLPAVRKGDWLETPLGRFPAPCGSSGAVQLFVRPQAIALSVDGPTARVLGRVLLGEIEEITLALPGLADPLVMRTSSRCEIEVGQEVNIEVAAKDVMVFSADDAARAALHQRS